MNRMRDVIILPLYFFIRATDKMKDFPERIAAGDRQTRSMLTRECISMLDL